MSEESDLVAELERSRSLGFLGPGPVEDHIAHARSFESQLDAGSCVLDLGSGGGVPGLVLAVDRVDLELVLLDARTRRADFLKGAVGRLGVGDRVTVLTGRAEELGQDPALRGRFDVVVSRSFGPPAVTAECAVGFLRAPGGVLLVSEPSDAEPRARWPTEGLAELGLRRGGRWDEAVATIQALAMVERCDDRYPRGVGRPAKRPLF